MLPDAFIDDICIEVIQVQLFNKVEILHIIETLMNKLVCSC